MVLNQKKTCGNVALMATRYMYSSRRVPACNLLDIKIRTRGLNFILLKMRHDVKHTSGKAKGKYGTKKKKEQIANFLARVKGKQGRVVKIKVSFVFVLIT